MSKFVFTVFPDEAKAYEGVRALKALHLEGSVTLYSHAVVQRDAQGVFSVKEKQTEGPIGTGVGALVGGLIGLFGGPVGLAVGLGGGTVLGALRDLLNMGLSNEFLETVSRELTPGRTAVVAEVSEEWVTPLDTRMEALGGSVVREMREDFIDGEIEKRIADLKWVVARRKAERAAAKAEKMEAKLKKEVTKAEEKLQDIAEKARERVKHYKEEIDAKIYALQEQASKTSPDAKSRIEERIAEMRAEQSQRTGKLEQARKLTQEALNP